MKPNYHNNITAKRQKQVDTPKSWRLSLAFVYGLIYNKFLGPLSVLLLVAALFRPLPLQAQQSEIDSLERLLANPMPDKLRFSLLEQLGNVYNDKNNPSEAGIARAVEAYELAQKLGDKAAEASALTIMGDLHHKVHKSDWAGAEKHYNKALAIRQALLKDSPNTVDARIQVGATLTDIAYLYWLWGRLNESLVCYDSSALFMRQTLMRDSTNLRSKSILARMLNGKGAILWAQGNYSSALDNYLEALSLFEETGETRRISLAYCNIGLIFSAWNRKDEALGYFRQALYAAQQIADPFAVGYSQNNIGKIFEHRKEYDSALVYFQASADNYMKDGRVMGMGFNLISIGNIYSKKGQTGKSLDAYQKALEIAESFKALYWVALAKQGMASLYLSTGDFEKATRFAKESLIVSLAENYGEITKNNYLTLSETYSAQGRFSDALESHKQYTAVKDSMFSEEKIKQITELQEQSESLRKEKENEVLRRNQLVQEENLRRVRTENYALAAGTALLLVFAVYALFNRQRMKRANKNLLEKNKEINQQKEEITQQAAQLTEINQVKDRMFSIISHDLRSPIGQLETILNLVQQEHISEKEVKQIMPDIAKSVGYVSDMLNNLLQWTKGQMQGYKITPKDFDLFELADKNARLLGVPAGFKGIAIKNLLAQNDCLVHADPDMVDLVLRNLIGNAIKFSKQGGLITLMAEDMDSEVVVSVADTGEGMTEEHLSKLFGKENFTTRGTGNEKGAGLGLQLCKDFVEKNGGRIWAESVLKRGSVFCFTLPKAIV